MATGHLDLFPGGIAPDGSGTGNTAAALSYRVSGAAQGSNSPKVTYLELLFDNTVDKHWLFQGVLPNDWASGLTLRGKVKFTGTTGNAFLKAAVVFGTDESTDNNALAFGAADVSAAVAAAATVGHTKEFSIPLTLSGAAARRRFVGFLGRDQDHVSNTFTGTVEWTEAWLEYTTA